MKKPKDPSPKSVFSEKKKKKPGKQNVTFRFDPDLYKKFRKKCEIEDRKVNQVFETFMKRALGEE